MGWFNKKDIELQINYNNKVYPSTVRLIPGNTDTPPVILHLDCNNDIYLSQLEKVEKSIVTFIDNETNIVKKLGFSSDSQLIYLFKNTSIYSLPNNLEKIEQAYQQKLYNSFSRFNNFLSQLSVTILPEVLSAISGRFYWNLLVQKDRIGLEWSLSDLYKLIYYYEWVYLIPIYQSKVPSIIDNKVSIS